MALRIYVGTLTAYFAGALRAGAASAPDAEAAVDQAMVRERILAWRTFVSEGLVRNGYLRRELDWDEEDEETKEAGLSVELPSDALRALKLILVHADSSVPASRMLPEQPELDPVWVAASESDFAESSFDQILAPEFWLPGDFDFTFACPYPDGHEVQAGSVGALAGQLAAVAERVFGGGVWDYVKWARDSSGSSEVVPMARRAAALLWETARLASDRGKPMLLHF